MGVDWAIPGSDATVLVQERWFDDGIGYQRIGDGPWTKVQNLNWHGLAPFAHYRAEWVPAPATLQGNPIAVIITIYQPALIFTQEGTLPIAVSQQVQQKHAIYQMPRLGRCIFFSFQTGMEIQE